MWCILPTKKTIILSNTWKLYNFTKEGISLLNIYICEDNFTQLRNMTQMINRFLTIENVDMKVVLSTSDPHEILNHITGIPQTGLYFLDVDLKSDINGISLAKEIRKHDPRGFIVFITSHAELTYLTFLYKVEAMDYIIKDNIDDMKERIHQCILNANEKYSAQTNTIHKTISFQIGDKIIYIKMDNIVYVEPSNNIHKVIIHTIDGITELTSSMKDLEQVMDSRFYRCHKSCIINKTYIQSVDLKNHVIYMTNGDICPVSTRLIKGLPF
jgi:Response regulator of the LytR/AlgR family